MAIDSSGNVYVTGQSWSANTSEYDYATVKYNADGQQQWVARSIVSGNPLLLTVCIVLDRGVVVFRGVCTPALTRNIDVARTVDGHGSSCIRDAPIITRDPLFF